MEVTRNTLTAHGGALPSRHAEESGLRGDVALRVSCKQYSPRCTLWCTSQAQDRALAGPQHIPDRTWPTGGGAGAVPALRGYMPFFSLGLCSHRQDGLAHGAVLVVGPFPHQLLSLPVCLGTA